MNGRIVTGVGVGIGALLAWWWWRRRRAASAAVAVAGPALGLTFPSWMTGQRPSSAGTELALAAGKQTARALAGQALDTYTKAEDLNLFWNTAENDQGAYWKAAYWLAVASRISKDGSLARAAGKNMVKGNALGATPGSGLKTGGITGIFSDAARLVSSAAKGNRQLGAIAKTLASFSDPKLIAAWQEGVSESSPAGIVKGTVAASAGDVATGASALRGIFTGELPRGMDPARWFFLKWGLRAGIVLSGGIGIWLMFSPKARKIGAAASSLSEAGRTFAGQARAAITAAKAAA